MEPNPSYLDSGACHFPNADRHLQGDPVYQAAKVVTSLHPYNGCLFRILITGIFAGSTQKPANQMCRKSSGVHLIPFSWLRRKTWDANPTCQEKVKPFVLCFKWFIFRDDGKVHSRTGFMAPFSAIWALFISPCLTAQRITIRWKHLTSKHLLAPAWDTVTVANTFLGENHQSLEAVTAFPSR